MHTTLNKLKTIFQDTPGWDKLLFRLGKTEADDEPLSLLSVMEYKGFDSAIWSLKTVSGFEREISMLTLKFARAIQHLMSDPRSIKALDVKERFLKGEATLEELSAAREEAALAGQEARDNANKIYHARPADHYSETEPYETALSAYRAACAAYRAAYELSADDSAPLAYSSLFSVAYAARSAEHSERVISFQEAELRKLLEMEM